MKKFLSFILVAVAVGSCFAVSACGKGDDKLEKVNAEQWKEYIESSRSAESYSYNCACNQYAAYASGEKRSDINSEAKGKIDKTNDVMYYEWLDSGSVIEDGVNNGVMFGRYYLSGEDTYASFVNSEGNFGEWGKGSVSETLKLSTDSLTYITGTLLENTETPYILSESYEKFTFDEEKRTYSAKIETLKDAEFNITISFKNGKIYNVDWITKEYIFKDSDDEERVVAEVWCLSYSYTFFDYNSTAVQLPEELKNL